MATVFYKAPFSWLEISGDETGLKDIEFVEKEGLSHDPYLLEPVIHQFDEYFMGKRSSFDLPLSPFIGTPFQQRVWQALMTIPYGKTISYRELAELVGTPKAVRAVGSANGKNRVPIIVPCHRVIATGGKLGGYSGGLDKKIWLLEHEQKMISSV